MSIEINSRLELSYQVQSKDLASALSDDPNDDFPEVFATSRMVAVMELAAARLMKSVLADNELSVGVNVNVNHFAATANNQEVKAVAIYTGREGKLYKFDVELYDAAGKAGSGTHTRAVVETERLVQGAASRAKG